MCCSVALLALVGRRSAWMQMPHLNDSFHMLRSLVSGSAESASHHEPKDPSSNPSPALPQLWRWKQTRGFLFSAWEIKSLDYTTVSTCSTTIHHEARKWNSLRKRTVLDPFLSLCGASESDWSPTGLFPRGTRVGCSQGFPRLWDSSGKRSL